MSTKLKRKISKKVKRILLSLLILFFTFFILLALVFIPPIQNKIVTKVTETLSENWGSDIKIGSIYLTPALKVAFKDLVINDLQNNAMISIDKGKTRLKEINFSPFELVFHSLELDGAEVLLRKYLGDDSINIGLWARSLKKNDDKNPFKLRADRLVMTNSRLLIHNENTITSGNSGDYIDYAYLELADLTFKAKDFSVNRDDISARITKLAFSQYSGFELLDGHAYFRINSNGLTFNKGKLVTERSVIFLDLDFDYDNWSCYSSFVDSVSIRAHLSPSFIHFADISCFAKALRGMDQHIVFSGDVNGTVNSLYVHDFSAFFRESNAFRGSLYMRDITDFKNGYYDINLQKTTVNIQELTKFLLPGGKQIPIPENLYPLGNIDLSVAFKGDFNTFSSKLAVNSSLGSASANFALYEAHDRYLFDAKASSSNFNVGQLLTGSDVVGNIAFQLALDGHSFLDQDHKMNIENSYANLKGEINRLDLFNYSVNGITLNGLLNGRKFDGHIHSADTNLNFAFNGLIDLSNQMPNFQSYISVGRFAPEAFLKNYPVIDSADAKGIDRIIYLAQQNPELALSFDSLEFNISGDRLDNLNGFAGVDGILFANGNDSIYGERIRLTTISTQSGIHRFILTSNFLNTTITTNYQLSSLMDSLKTIGHRYLPNIIPNTINDNLQMAETDTLTHLPVEHYFQLSLETFRTRELLNLFFPGLQIAPTSTCNLYISSLRKNDNLSVNTRRIAFKDKFRLHNMNISGRSVNDTVFNLALTGDSIVIIQKNQNLCFSNPILNTEIDNNLISYDLHWMNPDNKEASWLSGYVNAAIKDSIDIRFLSSSLKINETGWHFNEDHKLTFTKNGLHFDNLILESGISTIAAHGILSSQGDDNLEIKIKNVDLAQFNNFAANMNLHFGGDISATLRIGTWNKQRLFTGKVLVSDFAFNNAMMGNMFLTMAVPENTNVIFAGGLFNTEQKLNSATVSHYSIRNYNMESNILANLSGYLETEKKNLVIKANVDTLELGFLAPFFKSFSHRIDGKAHGELSFYHNPDSSYLDGKVNVLDAYLGIGPLNTVYRLVNQEIVFNKTGIEFPDVEAMDYLGNKAKITGFIHHNLFKDFVFNIGIETNRLLVLNTVKAPDVAFYGTGFVSGNVTMRGNGNIIRFHGSNLLTLPGTRLALPVMFSSKVSENDGIRFKTVSSNNLQIETEKSSAIMDFDFTFNVTKDAEVFVELDPAIGGSLSAKTEGTLQVRYTTGNDLILKGLVNISSGNYQMSFQDMFLNINMQLVEGGTMTFDGGISNSVIDAKALYRTMSSVKALDESMEVGRTQVNAYLALSGMLMNPTINFEFEFPNLNSDDNLRLNTAMNSTNVNSAATQFFSLVLTSSFISSGAMGENRNSYMANAGTEMFSGILNNLLFNNVDFFDEFGMNIRNVTQGEVENAMEFSLQGKKTVDRWIFQGDIGWRGATDGSISSDNSTATNSGSNPFIYDFSVEYMINRRGNLRAKAFVSSGNYDLNNMSTEIQENKPIAGGSLIFKVDFNNGEDIKNAFRRQKKSTNKKQKAQ